MVYKYDSGVTPSDSTGFFMICVEMGKSLEALRGLTGI
jgi:hypothetical protein